MIGKLISMFAIPRVPEQRLILARSGAYPRPVYSTDVGRVRSSVASPETIQRALDAYDLTFIRGRGR